MNERAGALDPSVRVRDRARSFEMCHSQWRPALAVIR
jgi:hypothetical protein